MSDPDFDKPSAVTSQGPLRPHVVNGYPDAQAATISWTRHLSVYVKILYKRRWVVSPTFFLVALITAVSTYTAVSIYGANAKLLIEVVQPNYTSFEGRDNTLETMSYDYLGTQYDLLKSRSLARKTLDKLHLWDNMPPKDAPKSFSLVDAATGLAMKPFTWVMGLVTGSSKTEAPGASLVPEVSAQTESKAESRSIDALLGMLSVTPVKGSRVVTLTARSFDPQLATAVVNAHAIGFIEQNTEFKFQTSLEASKWLTDRLAEQRKEVDLAEKALQAYRESHPAIPSEDSQNVTVQKLAQLSSAYTSARIATQQKEVVFNQLAAIGNNAEALAAFPPVLNSPLIQSQKAELATIKRTEDELLQTLDINHPKVKTVRSSIETAEAKLQTEIQNVVKSLRTDFEASQAQERSLGVALKSQNDEALTMSQDSIQFGILKREVDSARLIFQSLLQSSKETGISGQQRTTNVRIVDSAAVPRSPISPNRMVNMQMGLLGGLVLAFGLAFFLEYIDDRIKHPDEIKAYLGVPLLGLLPAVRGLNQSHDREYPTLGGVAWPKLNEAFRTLRTNVIFSSAEPGCRSIVVTSTGPNEGKTLVAANLARSLAEAGLRVLVIDADLRRPQQHKLFEVEQEPGLSNLIVGGNRASETIRKSSVPGLWVLPAGRIPPNPAELLASARFLEFFRTLSEHFDWVVVDTPPVMAVSDASVVAHMVTGVMFVVRAETVSRLAAQAALEQLDNARANIIGAVLNRVDLDRHSYYYSQYYRKEYSEYYAATPKA